MQDFTFDQIIDQAACHSSALSGDALIKQYRRLLIRYDEFRERASIARFIAGLLQDQSFYAKYPDTKWTEEGIYNYLNTYEI